MTVDDRAVVLSEGEGRRVSLGANHLVWKATGADTGGACAIMELVTVPESGSPYHIHHNEDESFQILSGTLTVYLDGRRIEAGPGSFVFIPRGLRHAFMNRGAEVVRSLVVLSPAGLEGFFDTLGSVEAPQDREGFGALAHQYNLEFFEPAE